MQGPARRAVSLVNPSFAAHRPRIARCSGCSQPAAPALYPSLTSRYYHPSRRRSLSNWAAAVSAAQNVFSAPPANSPIGIDPLRTVAKEMKFLAGNIRQLLGSGHPMLDTVAKYYTQSEGKYVRPMLVLLMSRATALTPKQPRRGALDEQSMVDEAITSPAILSDENPSAPGYKPLSAVENDAEYKSTDSDSDILPSQRRLAEITELIHTASLLHDDVIDHSLSRRSAPSANVEFGNKMAVLAGDFLLGRASVALARLRDPEVTELLSTVIANLVEGEFMQLKNTAQDEKHPVWTEDTLTYYLQKTYLKSASLISKSCRAAAILGQTTPEVVEAAYAYGKNLGLAFQLVDDMLDYTISGEELGKPAGADLELGLATAPLLFAWKENPKLGALVGRKFSKDGDVQEARDIVTASSGLEQTRALAQEYVSKAIAAISPFPDSDAKDGLIAMCTKVMERRKIDVSRRLRRAILLNDLDLVKRIVNNNPEWLQNPNFNDKSNTSLHVAAEEGFLEIAQFLIDAGHEDKGISRNADHATPLMLACSTSKPGCVDVGKLLVSRFPRCVSWANKAGMDALMLASRSGNLALVPILLTAGDPPCSPNAHDLDGNTALHHASAAGELKAIRILMQYGANPMAQNAYSWTPIAYSSTVAAEVYFKNLVAEVEKMRLEGKMHARERERQRHAGVRLVTREEGLESFARARSADDTDVLPPPPKLDWSPVESRRAMTPTGHRPGGWGEGMRARASSGD